MTDLRWPTQVRGKTTKAAGAASWLNRLLDACKMGTITDVKVIGGSVKWSQNAEGTTLIIDPKISGVESSLGHPFQIYNVAKIGGRAADDWRTFQIRGGYFGARSKYWVFPTFGNYEVALFNYGTDAGWNGYNLDDTIVPNTINGVHGQLTLPNVGDTNITETHNEGIFPIDQIILDSTFDGDNQIRASFWLEIRDNSGITNNFGLYLWARMYSPVPGTTGRTANPFPASDPSIIPIGTVRIYRDKTIYTEQYLTGNQLNRYTGADTFRGFWTADALAGQVFYTGDTVVDDTATASMALNSPSGNFSYYKVFRYGGGINAVANSPLTTPANWVCVGAKF